MATFAAFRRVPQATAAGDRNPCDAGRAPIGDSGAVQFREGV